MRNPWFLAIALICFGCGDSSPGRSLVPIGDVAVRMDFSRSAGFYDAPFPSVELQQPDGRIDLSRFPNPNRVAIIEQASRLIARDADGFSQSAGVYFSLTGEIDVAELPDVSESVAPDARVFLISVEDGRPAPVRVAFTADGGPFGAPNLLSLLPYQGVPLAPHTQYAAVVCSDLLDTTGHRLQVAPEVAELSAQRIPAGLSQSRGQDYLAAYAVAAERCAVAGIATFTTGSAVDALARFTSDALQRGLPVPSTFAAEEVFEDYCVFAATVDMPDYQQGVPPYANSGGDWQVDAQGEPRPPRYVTAKLFVTVPRRPMPADGFPTTVFVRAGGGGDRPLVDRGVHTIAGGPAAPGSGPAQEFARVGYAGVQVDGPLGGLRNTTQGDEQFLVFNVFNLAALRDNIRQSALELVVLSHVIDHLEIDTAACPGAPLLTKFDPANRVLMGHSTGATIAPLAAAIEPRYRAVILSGAGGSYIENVLYKRRPIEILPVATLILRYGDRVLTEHDPAINLFQWAAEPADPPVYAADVMGGGAYRDRAAHVLMLQGIVDNYILPNIANATSLSLGLDLAGPALDDPSHPALVGQTAILSALPLSGGRQISYPVSCNRSVDADCVTAVVVQHPGDDIEDGHEVVFQTEAPKDQYRAFLQSLLDGPPIVPARSSHLRARGS